MWPGQEKRCTLLTSNMYVKMYKLYIRYTMHTTVINSVMIRNFPKKNLEIQCTM